MEDKDRSKMLEERKKWYSMIFVLFEIAKTMKHREFCLINKVDKQYPHRYRFAFTVDRLKQHFERFELDKQLHNIYQSVAVLENMPILPYVLQGLKETPEYKEFNEKYEEKMIGYDLFIDIDGKENFELAFREAKEVKKVLDEYKLPYYVLNSSKTGFHFRIPSEYFENVDLDLFFRVVSNIKGIHGLTCIDDSVFDSKRLCKVPYSYECITGCICLPLNDAQFEHYRPESVELDNVMRYVRLKERGLLIRNHGLDEIKLRENVQKFLLQYK